MHYILTNNFDEKGSFLSSFSFPSSFFIFPCPAWRLRPSALPRVYSTIFFQGMCQRRNKANFSHIFFFYLLHKDRPKSLSSALIICLMTSLQIPQITVSNQIKILSPPWKRGAGMPLVIRVPSRSILKTAPVTLIQGSVAGLEERDGKRLWRCQLLAMLAATAHWEEWCSWGTDFLLEEWAPGELPLWGSLNRPERGWYWCGPGPHFSFRATLLSSCQQAVDTLLTIFSFLPTYSLPLSLQTLRVPCPTTPTPP